MSKHHRCNQIVSQTRVAASPQTQAGGTLRRPVALSPPVPLAGGVDQRRQAIGEDQPLSGAEGILRHREEVSHSLLERVEPSAARPSPRPEAEPVLEQNQGLAAISCYVACGTSRLHDHL
jgi:hypothetical protein